MPNYINKLTVVDGNSVIREIDLSQDTVSQASHIMSGYYGHLNTGERVLGTGQGGGTPSATQHSIYFEFSDNTNTTIVAYWDGTFISDAIRATTPTTYNNKTVTLAQLDGVTWYEPSAIPLNTQLIDFSNVENDKFLQMDGSVDDVQYYSVSDYTLIDPSMTFTYIAMWYSYMCFYNSSKEHLETIIVYEDGEQTGGNTGTGTLTPAKIPANAAYVRLCSVANPDASDMSLIRTA